METNRTDAYAGAHPDVEIIGAGMAGDSIVDHLFSIPAGAGAHGGEALWEAGVARRMERVLVERIRARIDGRAARQYDPISRA